MKKLSAPLSFLIGLAAGVGLVVLTDHILDEWGVLFILLPAVVFIIGPVALWAGSPKRV